MLEIGRTSPAMAKIYLENHHQEVPNTCWDATNPKFIAECRGKLRQVWARAGKEKTSYEDVSIFWQWMEENPYCFDNFVQFCADTLPSNSKSKLNTWTPREEQVGYKLDKDALDHKNREYSPMKCLWLTELENSIIITQTDGSKGLPQGIERHTTKKGSYYKVRVEANSKTIALFGRKRSGEKKRKEFNKRFKESEGSQAWRMYCESKLLIIVNYLNISESRDWIRPIIFEKVKSQLFKSVERYPEFGVPKCLEVDYDTFNSQLYWKNNHPFMAWLGNRDANPFTTIHVPKESSESLWTIGAAGEFIPTHTIDNTSEIELENTLDVLLNRETAAQRFERENPGVCPFS